MPAVSPWFVDDGPCAPSLRGDLDVDVAIVGAGYTGLSTALALRDEGVECAVLEARHAGFGASGRNAGHLTPTIGKDVPTLVRVFGRRRARALLALAETAIKYVEALITRYRIDCDYAPIGNVIAAVHPRQHATVDRAAAAAAALGAEGALLDAAAMRRRGLPAAFTRGFFEPLGGVLDPGRYVRGLRHALVAGGGVLFEATPVEHLDLGPTTTLRTEAGRVRARRVVIATNAYTPTLGVLHATVLPVRVQLFRTAPLAPAERAAVDWRGGEGIYTAHEMLESYRLTADGRIVGGAKLVRYAYGGGAAPDVDPDVAACLERTFYQRFPELRNLQIIEHWGGPIGFTLDFLPAVGRTGPTGNLFYAIGYAGHGVALASYAGRMIADLLAGRDGPGATLWARRVIPLPPEPLRWLVVRGLTSMFSWMDRRVDRGAAKRAPNAGVEARKGRAPRG
jgi:glycine/D-amino acid oxidase-like deaminating enzyme